MSYRVETAEGAVVGESDREAAVWRGIPYAAPPVGALRWRAPQPVEPWSGVRDATRFGAVAPQPPSRMPGTPPASLARSEDCLTLNVWSPGAPSTLTGTALRPVIVWFHGGAQTTGAGSLPDYSGRTLSARGDLVVVTLNYRLGALGFADFTSIRRGGSAFDSNLGLRDQLAALEWVRRNIAAFGGDPHRVTIMGESSGGTAVTTMMALPAARGLFRSAVAQSPLVSAVLTRERSAQHAERMLDLLGIAARDVRRLQDIPVRELLRATATLVDENSVGRAGTLALGPVVDGAFLPKHPLEVLAEGRGAKVPLVVGTTRDEAALFEFGDPPLLPLRRGQIESLLDRIGADARGRPGPSPLRRLRDAYGDTKRRRVRQALAADWSFTMPSLLTADGHSTVAPTFVYRYDYAPPAPTLVGLGAMHGSELPLLFGTLDAPIGRLLLALGGRAGARRRAIGMQDQLIAFVRSGSPGWTPYTPETRMTRLVGSRATDTVHPAAALLPAWDGIRFTI